MLIDHKLGIYLTESPTDLAGLDLRGQEFNGADMRGVSLRRSILDGCDMRRCDLSKSDLRGASMRGVDLTRAKMQAVLMDTGTDLRGASLHAVTGDPYLWPMVCTAQRRRPGNDGARLPTGHGPTEAIHVTATAAGDPVEVVTATADTEEFAHLVAW